MKNPTAKKIMFSLVSGGLLGVAMSATPVLASNMGSYSSGHTSMGQKANPCRGKNMSSKHKAKPCKGKSMSSNKKANPCAGKNADAGKMGSKKKSNPCAGKKSDDGSMG